MPKRKPGPKRVGPKSIGVPHVPLAYVKERVNKKACMYCFKKVKPGAGMHMHLRTCKRAPSSSTSRPIQYGVPSSSNGVTSVTSPASASASGPAKGKSRDGKKGKSPNGKSSNGKSNGKTPNSNGKSSAPASGRSGPSHSPAGTDPHPIAQLRDGSPARSSSRNNKNFTHWMCVRCRVTTLKDQETCPSCNTSYKEIGRPVSTPN